jgi:hypothetical protein
VYDVKREVDWHVPVQSSVGMAGGHTDPVWCVSETVNADVWCIFVAVRITESA